jgi:hypothetical protein
MSCEHWIRTNQLNSNAILAQKPKNQKKILGTPAFQVIISIKR